MNVLQSFRNLVITVFSFYSCTCQNFLLPLQSLRIDPMDSGAQVRPKKFHASNLNGQKTKKQFQKIYSSSLLKHLLSAQFIISVPGAYSLGRQDCKIA